MTDLHELSALEQAELIRTGELSPTELTRHYLDRIDKLDDTIGAYLTVTHELALEQAETATAQLRDGGPRSALHGVPIPVKDLTFVAGVRCTFGSAAYAGHVAARDDFVVTKMREAGLVILGKTNTPELALPCYTENAIAPPTRNPWDITRTPAGSSGGSAAAVASGLAPVAHGTDAGGSVRMPASACGLVGLKPSRGRVSNGPAADVLGLSAHGALTRTVADAAALLDVMTGAMPGDTGFPPPADGAFLDHAARRPRPLRIAAMVESLLPGIPVHAEVERAHHRTAQLLRELGHEVTDVTWPGRPLPVEAFGAALSVLSALPQVGDESQLMPFTRHLRSQAAAVSGPQLAQVIAAFHDLALVTSLQLLTRFDLILTPTLAHPPGPIGSLRVDGDPEAEFAIMAAFMPYTPVQNITGQPSISLPGQPADDGLPIGVMLSGSYGDEATLISLAAQIEAADPWAGRKPDLW